MKEIINALDTYLGKKAPQLPKAAKEWIVKYAPYLIIIGLILLALSVLSYMRISSYARFFYYSYGPSMSISVILEVIAIILYAIALPGLFKKSASGWNFSFYGAIVSSISSFEPISIIISLLVSLYVLFQIRPYYFGGAIMANSSAEEKPMAGSATGSAPTNTAQGAGKSSGGPVAN
ncbi:MAG TPA: hypothetical protein P5328_01270 [Candidatus Paceibacterota bacterium]|nr:hypothetical protein [Candidatus Paceibacterota bacterium]HRZ34615.1 hypothetical protein [Candidatus Paceibacterota bacterium]